MQQLAVRTFLVATLLVLLTEPLASYASAANAGTVTTPQPAAAAPAKLAPPVGPSDPQPAKPTATATPAPPHTDTRAPLKLSLRDAIVAALGANHTLKKAKDNYFGAKSAIDTARSAFLPTFAFQSNLGTLHDRQPNVGEQTVPLNPRDRNSYDAHLVLDQPLYSGLRDLNNYRAKEASLKEQEWNLKSAALDLTTQIIQFYFGIQLDLRQLRAEREIAKLRAEQLGEVKSRMTLGRATDLDLLQAEYDAKAEEPQIKTFENDIASKSLHLARLIGMPVDQQFFLTDELEDIGAILQDSKLGELQETYKVAIERSAKLQAGAMTVQRITYETERDYAKHYPDLSFELTAGTMSNYRNDIATEQAVTYSGMLKLNVPLFSGLSSFSENQENSAKITAAVEDENLLRDQILIDLTDAYRSFDVATSRVEAEAKNAELSRKSIENARNLYNNGRATLVDVLNSYTRMLTAEHNQAQALYDRLLALATIRELTTQ